jgi:hypothetical protein
VKVNIFSPLFWITHNVLGGLQTTRDGRYLRFPSGFETFWVTRIPLAIYTLVLVVAWQPIFRLLVAAHNGYTYHGIVEFPRAWPQNREQSTDKKYVIYNFIWFQEYSWFSFRKTNIVGPYCSRVYHIIFELYFRKIAGSQYDAMVCLIFQVFISPAHTIMEYIIRIASTVLKKKKRCLKYQITNKYHCIVWYGVDSEYILQKGLRYALHTFSMIFLSRAKSARVRA